MVKYKKFFYPSLFLFLITYGYGFVSGEVFNKNKILGMEIKKDKPKNCPSYSDGYSGHSCEYHFYCRGDECSTKDSQSLVKFTNANGEEEKFIPDTCSEFSLENENCTTKHCYGDTECLSNRCVNKTCMVNEASPVMECMNTITYNSQKFKYTPEMYCGKSNHEPCEYDDDCASRNCDPNGYCLDVVMDRVFDQIFYQLFEIGAIVCGIYNEQ
ncbi:hypothetical protein PIROE2DRAFT_14107 [Piromyces sp. E2]|nr:hypothetical protein PIROE2DRAFT_14107 [Piromyces sp. E2]|eukprot:OUM60184.1 hypothetical protein PIROE2DRAFT_14107 [Piromyces sp. E2]